MNIVSTIMQLLGPVIVNRIAASLGLNQGLAGKAVAAIVPAILAGLAGKASTSSGAGQLASALGRQDTGLLGNLANIIGGSGQQALVDSGTSALGSLLGGGATSALAAAAGKFAGIGEGPTKSLVGMLAPVVLGSLAKEQKSAGLDAGGLASLLAGQKDNIAAAMPAGFSDLLAGSGLLDSISGNLRPGAVARPAPQAMAPSTAGGMPGIFKILLPLAVALAALYLISGRGCERAESPPAPPASSTPAPKSGTSIGDLTTQATTAIDALKSALGTVKDEASARATLPKLQDLAAEFGQVRKAAEAMPADVRHPLVVMISGVLPGVAAAIDKAMAIPGVSAVLKPVLDQALATLTALAKS